jgi:hypothetical protein
MKATKLNTLIKNLFLLFFSIMILHSFDSYAKKFIFLSSAIVPAARGYAKVTRDNNKNYIIEVQVSNLSEVNRLQPAKRAYVVWMISDQEITKNIGQLNSATTFLSTKLKADYKTASSSKPIKIFITAEDDAGTQSPGEQLILSTDRFFLD